MGDSTRNKIRLEAQRMFRNQGYSATSMRDLAKKVGIQPASLYNHLESKEWLLREICFEMADEFFKAFNDAVSKPGSTEQKLVDAVKAHVGVITRHADRTAIFLHEWRHLESENLTEFKAMRHRYEEGFHKLIEKGVGEKVFKTNDVHFYCRALLSSISWVHDWFKPTGKLSPDQIGERLAQLFLKGIKEA